MQNDAARLITRKSKHDSISDTSMELHWLPVEPMLIFKTLLVVFKCIHGICSENLISKLKFKKCNCRLDDYVKLETEKVFTRFGLRTFAYAGPRLWNSLPLNL